MRQQFGNATANFGAKSANVIQHGRQILVPPGREDEIAARAAGQGNASLADAVQWIKKQRRAL